jgi:hypothetical protein
MIQRWLKLKIISKCGSVWKLRGGNNPLVSSNIVNFLKDCWNNLPAEMKTNILKRISPRINYIYRLSLQSGVHLYIISVSIVITKWLCVMIVLIHAAIAHIQMKYVKKGSLPWQGLQICKYAFLTSGISSLSLEVFTGLFLEAVKLFFNNLSFLSINIYLMPSLSLISAKVFFIMDQHNVLNLPSNTSIVEIKQIIHAFLPTLRMEMLKSSPEILALAAGVNLPASLCITGLQKYRLGLSGKNMKKLLDSCTKEKASLRGLLDNCKKDLEPSLVENFKEKCVKKSLVDKDNVMHHSFQAKQKNGQSRPKIKIRSSRRKPSSLPLETLVPEIILPVPKMIN